MRKYGFQNDIFMENEFCDKGEGIKANIYQYQCIQEAHHLLPSTDISGTSLVAQMVKSPPAMQETWVPSLGCEDPLEKGMATHSSILAWRIPWTEAPVRGVSKSGTQLSDFHFH